MTWLVSPVYPTNGDRKQRGNHQRRSVTLINLDQRVVTTRTFEPQPPIGEGPDAFRANLIDLIRLRRDRLIRIQEVADWHAFWLWFRRSGGSKYRNLDHIMERLEGERQQDDDHD